MLRILIVFGSEEGQTAKVAEFIATRLRDRKYQVDVERGNRLPKNFDINAYDAIVVAGSVHMMKYQKYIVSFAKKFREHLDAVPSAFISISMAEAHKNDPERGYKKEWLDNFINETGWKPAKFGSFAGALRYRDYNIIIRSVMKKIAGEGGLNTDTSRNHEYTDWDALGRFTDEFADSLSQ